TLEPRRLLAAYSIVDLGTLGGSYAVAYGINKSGQIVGESTTSTGAKHAFVYSTGKLKDLGTLGGSRAAAYGINDLGHIVGESTLGDGHVRAFFYSSGSMKNLGVLP